MPIRVGVIGLSAKPDAWASVAHVGPLKSNPDYELVALSASTPESAAAAAKAHGLPANKGYSSAEALAQDPDVDLVVVSVKLQHHVSSTRPAIEAGKDVFVEWPLGNGVAEADELAKLAKAKGVKNIVGLQTRRVPAILKIKELVDSGVLGRITSTTLQATSTYMANLPERYDYIADVRNGVNILTVSGGHNLDSLTYVLGEFKSLSATTHQLYTLKLVNAAGEGRAVESTSPDSFSISGTLESGAAVSVSLTSVAGGKTNPESATWIIHGEKGALKLEAPNLMLAFPPQKLSLYKDGAWEEIETEAINAVGSIYETFANAGPGGEGLVSFEQAVVRHRLVEAIIKSARDGTRESYKTTY